MEIIHATAVNAVAPAILTLFVPFYIAILETESDISGDNSLLVHPALGVVREHDVARLPKLENPALGFVVLGPTSPVHPSSLDHIKLMI